MPNPSFQIFGLAQTALADLWKPYFLTLSGSAGSAGYHESCLQPIGRELAVFAGERIARAEVG